MNIHRSVMRRSKYGFIVGRYHIAHAGSDAGTQYMCAPYVVGNQLVHPKTPRPMWVEGICRIVYVIDINELSIEINS